MKIRSNRRNRSRQSVNIEGEYYYAKKWTHCELYDLSTTGAALKLKQSFVVMDKIKIRIGEAVHTEIEARVVNVNGCRTGIEFENVGEREKSVIESMISRHAKAPKPAVRYAAASFSRNAE